MSNAQEFHVFSWLPVYLQTPIDPQAIQQVLNFCLMWNLFESKLCNYSASPALIERVVANLPSFADLNFRDRDNEPLVRSVLDGSTSDPTAVMQCLLLVIWRFRNNLFHGLKPLLNLKEQNDNFEHANEILANFLDLECSV